MPSKRLPLFTSRRGLTSKKTSNFNQDGPCADRDSNQALVLIYRTATAKMIQLSTLTHCSCIFKLYSWNSLTILTWRKGISDNSVVSCRVVSCRVVFSVSRRLLSWYGEDRNLHFWFGIFLLFPLSDIKQMEGIRELVLFATDVEPNIFCIKALLPDGRWSSNKLF